MADNGAGEERERSAPECLSPPATPKLRQELVLHLLWQGTTLTMPLPKPLVPTLGKLCQACCRKQVVHVCVSLCVRTRVPTWHVLLKAELAWAGLDDGAGPGQRRAVWPPVCARPRGDAFRTPPLVPACSLPWLPGQGYAGEEGRLISAPNGSRGRDSPPPWRGTGRSHCHTPALAACVRSC